MRHPKVKRITGILYPDDDLLRWSIEELTNLWGCPELISIRQDRLLPRHSPGIVAGVRVLSRTC